MLRPEISGDGVEIFGNEDEFKAELRVTATGRKKQLRAAGQKLYDAVCELGVNDYQPKNPARLTATEKEEFVDWLLSQDARDFIAGADYAAIICPMRKFRFTRAPLTTFVRGAI